ncbi:MAG: hypothetical protein OXI38_04260 [Bacteroidota bacterium]|nr:hypothetical protein [Bacteroidota bacterium]
MPKSVGTERVLGQASWRLSSPGVEAFVTRLGGHLGPVVFRLDDCDVNPYAVCPWAEEPMDMVIPPILRVLRGDFFCMPFGANEAAFRQEQHPPHGEAANGNWQLESLHSESDSVTLHASLATCVRTGRVDKYIRLRGDNTAIYCRHVIAGMDGPMSLGHHAMLKFPEAPGSGLISTSPFVWARTAPLPVELPENQGYSLLKPDAAFTSLEEVPTITGELSDLSRYPARRGYEDLVMVVADPALDPAWTAVTFPAQRFVWFALKDPSVLRQTVFWFSNGGRYYPPWDGRHTDVMGLEEVTSYFHYGLAESAHSNPLDRAGHRTCLQLNADSPLDVRYIMGVVSIPDGFDRVESIEAGAEAGTVRIRSASGIDVHTAVDLSFMCSG